MTNVPFSVKELELFIVLIELAFLVNSNNKSFLDYLFYIG